MLDEFVIKSVNDATALRFCDMRRGTDHAYFTVNLAGPPVHAGVEVYELSVHQWSAFFADLAANWRGWVGTKTAESLEGHLHVAATSDRAGHVRLRVRLRDLLVENDWLAEVNIHLEAGQLDQIASAAAGYFGQRTDRK